ncbi:MAG: hypothetical protein HYS07_09715 [Chlamydiae bacterium]|nr:hypothetical protein [Chlamydiota bacterium]MBI3277953.1 hypothetical protein [Chlamydiota bacterium]
MKRKCYHDVSPVACDPRLANQIIYGAIEYAQRFGFEPQEDFKLARFVLDEPLGSDGAFDVKFGKEGKPFFVAGPYDPVDEILQKLSTVVGEGNYYYLHPVSL